MVCPHYKDVSVYDCKDCNEGLPSPETQEEISSLRRQLEAAQQQLKIRIDQFTAERTRAERSERRAAVLSDRVATLEAAAAKVVELRKDISKRSDMHDAITSLGDLLVER